MEMVAEGRVGSSEQRHPRHLAAEGHAPVRLHAFSTGYSSDSPSLSLRHTWADIQTATAEKQCLRCRQSTGQ